MTPAEVIAAHGFRGQDHGTINTTVTCGCGWSARLYDYDDAHRLAHAQHVWECVVAALADMGKSTPTKSQVDALRRILKGSSA